MVYHVFKGIKPICECRGGVDGKLRVGSCEELDLPLHACETIKGVDEKV